MRRFPLTLPSPPGRNFLEGQPRKQALGCAAHSWRVAQAWIHGGAVDGRKYIAMEGYDHSGQSWSTFLCITCRTSRRSICLWSRPLAFARAGRRRCVYSRALSIVNLYSAEVEDGDHCIREGLV